MPRRLAVSGLIAVAALAAAWSGFVLSRPSVLRPLPGPMTRSKVDDSGHTRGIVQVDLMRRILQSQSRLVPTGAGTADRTSRRVPSPPHPRLDREAPPFVLADADGQARSLREALAQGPVVVVFYLGASCVACVTHLVRLDAALASIRERGASVWAISVDAPEVSRRRARQFGTLAIPLLSDPDRGVATAYGAFRPVPGGDPRDGEPLHATFVIASDGMIRWAYVGDRPFDDVDALLAELSSLTGETIVRVP